LRWPAVTNTSLLKVISAESLGAIWSKPTVVSLGSGPRGIHHCGSAVRHPNGHGVPWPNRLIVVRGTRAL
jgi:hypothetical protein